MTIEATGVSAAKARLEGIAARLRDLTPVTSVAAADTMTLIDDSFASSTSPAGEAFAPLAPSTIAKRRYGSGERRVTPMIDTGRARSSMFARGERDGLRFGTNVGYVRPHVTGGTFLPKRNPLPAELIGGSWSLTQTGAGGSHWSRVRESIRRYITTGEVT